MAGQSQTLDLEGSLIGEGNGKESLVRVLDSDLHIDSVCGDVDFDGSIEEDKDVKNPTIEGGIVRFEGSQFVRSLESKSENEKVELSGNEITLKTLEKEVMSDVIQAELDVRRSVGVKDSVFGKINDSQKEEEIGEEGFNDSKKRRAKDGKVVKCAFMKSSGKSYQASYELPTKKGRFSVCDLVWGKVRSHPWWPGQIFDPSDSSAQAKKHFKKNHYLVAYFGDGTFAWNEASKLKSFRTHFSYIEKQKNSDVFRSAVDSALDEVKRRVEFGLACSCVPKDTYDKIKLQIVDNCGIRQEPSFVHRVDESLNVSSFVPEKLMEYLKDLSKLPTGGFDRLELLIAKAQLLALNRLKGYSYLPELQYCGGLGNDTDISINDTDKRLSEVNEHTIHVSKIGDKTGTGDTKTTNRSCRKHKHNLKDGMYPAKKKNLLKQASGTPDSTHGDYQNDEAIANLISPVFSKKRKTVDHYVDVSGKKGRRNTISLEKVSNTTKQSSFKIGECIRRVAKQLTVPLSALKYPGDRSLMADGNADSFSGNESDFFSPNLETQKSNSIFPTEFSSLDDLLSLLQWVAHEPQGDYSFLNVIVSFFSDFRNSIIIENDSGKEILPTNEVGTKRKNRTVSGSPEIFDFDDPNDTYCTDMVIQNGSKEQQSQRSSRLNCQHAPSELEKPIHVYTRRSNSRKKYFDSNHAEVPEKPSGYIDEKSPAELVLKFAELDSVLSETSLNNIFKHFGPLKESETEIDRGSSQARVVFKKCADAEAAFSSAKKFNIFGRTLVNYQLNYAPSALLNASSFVTTQDQELHLDLSNAELNMV
ncbi:PWWP domain-containing protein 5-like [Cicer arietinum]|uniref:Uncharacterized protein LOC101489065 n=1 Tax=Cicer arietinum TaxID=3827 RepID=A0A1S3E417_CICAR|nr:uncharacterized protein LOC101489065 [Cicer arietinum]